MHFLAEQAADDIASPKLTKMAVTVLTFFLSKAREAAP
jgi:hypothetical protein